VWPAQEDVDAATARWQELGLENGSRIEARR
jgi:hypothetical protein